MPVEIDCFFMQKIAKNHKPEMSTLILYSEIPKLFNKFDERTIQRGDFGYAFYLTADSKNAPKYSD